MAKQESTQPITGTIDGICFYQMDGMYYARQKSSLEGERVKQDPAFAQTMRYAGLFAKASLIGKRIYASLPAHIKNRKVYQQLTGNAMLLLKAGSSEEECYTYCKDLVEKFSIE